MKYSDYGESVNCFLFILIENGQGARCGWEEGRLRVFLFQNLKSFGLGTPR